MLHWEIMQLRLILGLVVLLTAVAFVGVAHEVLTPAAALDSKPLLVDIPAHKGVLDIAGRLYAAGAIRSRVGFVLRMTTEEILTRMVQRFRAKLDPDVAARAQARGLSVHQLLTLASIIEREAVARDELRTISGVFWNRLKLNMPLQADPTVQYATGKERRALTRAGEVPLLRRHGRPSSLFFVHARRAQRGRRPVPARPRSVNRAIKRATWPAPPRLPRTSASPARRRRCRSCIARSAGRCARRSGAGSISASRDSSISPRAARISSRRITTTIWTGSSSASPLPSRSPSS